MTHNHDSLNHSSHHNHSHHYLNEKTINSKTRNKLFLVMILNFIITIAEIIGGIISGSLSLISDALHNFSDGISVIITYITLKLREKKSSSKFTFGYKRAEILAALINSSTLIGISLYLFYQVYLRLTSPPKIEGKIMIWVAAVGLVANLLSTLLLYKDSHKSINIKSSYLHLLTDALSSIGVILGAVAIIVWDLYIIDPIITIIIAIYVIKESFDILKTSIHILMQGAPSNIDLEQLKKIIVESNPKIKDIHHIHMWLLNDQEIHLEAHIDVEDLKVSECNKMVQDLKNTFKNSFGITHTTLQFENGACVGLNCKTCQDKDYKNADQ